MDGKGFGENCKALTRIDYYIILSYKVRQALSFIIFLAYRVDYLC
jgi:hypothetical protein